MSEPSFAELGLDARLVKAMRKMGFEQPTAVQARCIPLALEGHDLLARAPTGSGKTVAYVAPLLQQILTDLESGVGGSSSASGIRALILVPTRELCNQVHGTVSSLLAYAAGAVRAAHVAGDEAIEAQRARLAPGSLPHVLIATPARLLQHLNEGTLKLESGVLGFLVVDEADLLQSYGYAPDLEQVGPLLRAWGRCVGSECCRCLHGCRCCTRGCRCCARPFAPLLLRVWASACCVRVACPTSGLRTPSL
jgi:ATP-dependent RNA helicase DDX56/DBP9